MIEGGGLSINKEKIADLSAIVKTDRLINGKYMLVQKGRKNYYVVIVK
jgi:tyrosyl-tRNA synthetase